MTDKKQSTTILLPHLMEKNKIDRKTKNKMCIDGFLYWCVSFLPGQAMLWEVKLTVFNYKKKNTGKLRLRPSIFLSQCRKDGTELKIYCCCWIIVTERQINVFRLLHSDSTNSLTWIRSMKLFLLVVSWHSSMVTKNTGNKLLNTKAAYNCSMQ